MSKLSIKLEAAEPGRRRRYTPEQKLALLAEAAKQAGRFRKRLAGMAFHRA